MTPGKRQSFIYKTSVQFKRNIFLMFFALSSLFLFVLVVSLIYSLFPDHDKFFKFGISLFIGITGSIIATILGSILSVIFELPTIFIKFDHIKNMIANRDITTCKDFSKKVNKFFVDNLRYTFLSVDYSLIKILKHPLQSSDTIIFDLLSEKELNEIENLARSSADVQQYKPFTTNGKLLRAYIIPIYFANKYFGYWIVLTGKRLLKPFVDFLSDIEDHLLDDQVRHVLNHEKMTLQREFFILMDSFSNKITLNQYNSLNEYIYDILQLIVETCKATGGVCITVYSEEYITYFKNDIDGNEQSKLVETAIELHPLKSEILKVPECSNKYIFSLPIMITELRGYIYLIDDSRSNLEYFRHILQDIENLKIDNDLEQLSLNMKLNPVHSI